MPLATVCTPLAAGATASLNDGLTMPQKPPTPAPSILPTFLAGPRVLLRPMEMADIPSCVRWRNDPEVRQYVFSQFPHSETEARKRIELAAEARDRVELAIIHRPDGVHIGQIGLHLIDWRNRNCFYGIIVGESAYRAKGLGFEATELLLGFAFGTLNLHRVALDVYEINHAAIRCYERLGFTRESVCREARWANGRFWDIYRYAMLDTEFQPGRTDQRTKKPSTRVKSR